MRKSEISIFCDECGKFLIRTLKPPFIRPPTFIEVNKNKKVRIGIFKGRVDGITYYDYKDFCSEECENKYAKKWEAKTNDDEQQK